MAAPLGNQFWKIRSKHGRDMLFSSPELLWEAASEYFEWCEDNPLMDHEAKVVSNGGGEGSSVEIVQIPKKRVFTLHGLCLYLGCNTDYFKHFRNQERAKREDFSPIMKAIEQTIYDQKYTGAASGLFNANIIARDLGLTDNQKIDQSNTGEIRVIYDDDKIKAPPSGTEANPE